MRRIFKVYILTILLLSITVLLTGCSLPYSVSGKTYEYSSMNYELTEVGENKVREFYYGSVAAFLNSKSDLIYKTYVFNSDGTGYYSLMLTNTLKEEFFGSWIETDDEVIFTLDDSLEQIIFQKTSKGLCVNLIDYMCCEEPEFTVFDIYYQEVK